ncbi:hypothetical protein BOH72_26275 [Mycobacterium sp. WY10]|nr:hypothetical protein BOH72_26275 [Mycobacterium sp. WY10]
MTGMEPVVGMVGAAAKAVGKAIEEDPQEAEVLRRIGEKSGALDTASEISAKRAAVKQQIRLKLWQPLGMLFGVSREYFENHFESEMADKLADIPEDDLVTPKLSIAGPTVQGISFTVEEPDLRSMYLNLLATASDRRVESKAHPSFAEVIRQLSAEEARLLTPLLRAGQIGIVEIRRNVPDSNGYNVLAEHVCALMNERGEQVYVDRMAVFVDNWVRLGLIQVDYSRHLKAENAYAWVRENPKYVSAQQQYDTPEQKVITFGEGVVSATQFGKLFHSVVIEPPQTAAAVPVAADGKPPGAE